MNFRTFFSLLLFLFVLLQSIFSVYKSATTFEPDFSIFYQSAKDILQNTSPYRDKHLYTAFNYPLTTAALFIPLTVFSYQTAQIIFTLLNVTCLFVIIFLSIRLSKQKITLASFFFLSSLALLFFPTKFTLGMGQINLIAYMILLAGVYAFSINKTKTAQLLIILSVLCKPIFLFVLILFLLQKKYLFFFITFAFSCTVLFLVPMLLQHDATFTFIKELTTMSFAGREVYYNQGLTGFISRMTLDVPFREYFTYIVSVMFFILTFIVIKKRILLQQFSLLLTLLVILDPLSWQHHFIFLLFPCIQLFYIFLKKKNAANMLLLLFSFILIGMNIKTPQSFILFPESIFLSHVFFGTLLLFILQLFYVKEG